MSKNYEKLAQQILDLVAGKENISFVMHCATRLRFTLVDESKVDIEGLNALPEVITVLNSSGQFQVVIGNDVSLVFKELNKLGNFSQTSNREEKIGKSKFDKFFEIVSGIFTPIVPILMAAGMVGALLTILSLTKILPSTSSTYYVFNLIKEAGFYFLPIYVGYTAANKLGTNPFLAMLLAAILVHPQLSSFESLGLEQLDIFGIPIKNVKYANSVLPAILGVWLLSYVERFFNKYTPSAVRAFISPMMTMIVTMPIVLLVIGPAGGYVADMFGLAVQTLGTKFGFIFIAILAGLMPLMIVTGTHSFVFPLVVATLAQNGSESILIPAMMAENLAMAGAAFALSTMTKDVNKKAEARAASLSAILGISEPAMYGVVLPERKAFYSTMVGSLIGGAFAGIFGLSFYTIVSASVTGLPGTFAEGEQSIFNFMIACLTMLISFVVTFIITKLLVTNKKGKDIIEKKVNEEVAIKDEVLKVI
ncbi:MAG: PTS transporter subunit EIIC [Lactovum sp.]